MIPVLNTILDSVVDTIAPPTPAFENFIYHWEKLMVNYVEWTADGMCSQTHVEQTNVPDHLEILKQIILSEDEIEEETTNLCMEYILKNNIFNVLAIIAEKEKLIGVRILIIKLMSNLIHRLKNPVLAHQNVFGAIQKLINLCNYNLYKERQLDQIHFLHTLCMLLDKQQNIAIMFFSYEFNVNHSEKLEMSEELGTQSTLNVLDCVLSYINTKNTDVFNICCDCILLLIKLNVEIVMDSITKNTGLCSTLSTHLKSLFNALPTTLDYNGLEMTELNWRDNYNATYSNDVTKYFCWLDFIVEVIREGQLKISCSLCESLKFVFLNELFGTTEDISLSNVFLLKKMYRAATYTPLNYTMNNWLRSEFDYFNYNKQTPIDILIKLSTTKDDVYVFHLLSFFIDMLFNMDQDILDFIVLRFVNGRNYYERSALGSWSDEEDEREKKLMSNKNNLSTSRTLAPSSIDRIINRLLALVPQNLQSDPLHTFKDHVTSTKYTYEDIFIKCKKFNWPSEAIDSFKLNDFDEGPFLRMIFRKMDNIPNQNLSVTLLLKIIIIFLCSLPHPYLHEYMLNSTLPLKRNVPTIYTVLCQVFKDLHKNILAVPNFNDKLICARKQILNSTPQKLLNEKIDDQEKLFESAVILEELCKELVAVLFVKYHHSNLSEQSTHIY